MKVTPQLYIGSERLDLFDDEKISVNLTIKNLRAIDTVFTDFSQSFTIPASRQNNKVMQHWYKSDVITSFVPQTKRAGRIDLNGITFRTGVYRLEAAKIKDGKPESYQISFYGNLRSLGDLFKEDLLTDLDLSAYHCNYADYAVSGINSVSLAGGNAYVPLITPNLPWFYHDPTTVYDFSFPIKYAPYTREGGIKFIDLKPALKVYRILDAIEADYGITLNLSTEFNNALSDMYMWAHGAEGRAKGYEKHYEQVAVGSYYITGPAVSAGLDFDEVSLTNQAFSVQKSSTSGYSFYYWDLEFDLDSVGNLNEEDVNFDLICYDEANDVVRYEANFVGNVDVTGIQIDNPTGAENDGRYRWAVRSDFPLDWTLTSIKGHRLDLGTPFSLTLFDNRGQGVTPSRFTFSSYTYTDTLFTNLSYTTDGQLPRTKVKDFLNGLVRMFNGVIDATSSTEFTLSTWDEYMAAGNTIDAEKYIKSDEYEIKPSSIAGEIFFKYTDSNTVLAKNFRESRDGVGYGYLRSFIVDSNGEPINPDKIEVKLPFTNLIFENLVDSGYLYQGTGLPTGIVVGKSLDASNKGLVEQPILIYNAGTVNVSDHTFGVRDRLIDDLTEVSNYQLSYQFNDDSDSYTKSLNWGTEINPYTGNDGTATSPSLYYTYWRDYITDLYDIQARRYTMKAVLPIGFLLNLNLNDKLKFGTNVYRINSMNVDITTGESTLDLINEID